MLTPPWRVVCKALTPAGAGQSGMMQCLSRFMALHYFLVGADLSAQKRANEFAPTPTSKRGDGFANLSQQLLHVLRHIRLPLHAHSGNWMFQCQTRGMQCLTRKTMQQC